MGQLDGKLAVITGVAGGIGLAIAQRFITEGARSGTPAARSTSWLPMRLQGAPLRWPR